MSHDPSRTQAHSPNFVYGVFALGSSLLLATCMLGAAGPPPARAQGSTSDAPLTHFPTNGRPVDRCGGGAFEPAGAVHLARAPYLQQVTAHSALVMFTSTSPAPVTIDVSRPQAQPSDGGAPLIASVRAKKDESARISNAWQGLARIEGLEPGTLYCYSLRGLTHPAGFVTAPEQGSDQPVRFVAFGDSGDGGPGQYAVLDQLNRVPFDFLTHTGDLAYGRGRQQEIESHVFKVYAPLFKSYAFFPASGNHEYLTDDAAPFRQAFALPENGGPAGRERYYSFDWGYVHLAVLDTERVGPEQAAWLDADLAASHARWNIVYGHRPPFSSGRHGSARDVQKAFVPILQRHHVPLMLSGHEHDYERTRPIGGVTFIVTGGGGRQARSVGHSDFTAVSVSTLHFVHVEADHDALVLRAIDAGGREFDMVRIGHPG
jgi:hypothetical protein